MGIRSLTRRAPIRDEKVILASAMPSITSCLRILVSGFREASSVFQNLQQRLTRPTFPASSNETDWIQTSSTSSLCILMLCENQTMYIVIPLKAAERREVSGNVFEICIIIAILCLVSRLSFSTFSFLWLQVPKSKHKKYWQSKNILSWKEVELQRRCNPRQTSLSVQLSRFTSANCLRDFLRIYYSNN